MNRGLYVAASGMLAMQARQDQLSNDLANASTPGYKQDRTAQRAFGELLVRNVQGNQQVGTMAAGVRLEEQTTDFRAAPLRQTDEPLDLAVDGDGFFGVQTAQGVRYTRNGQFTSAADGTLVDQLGNKVLGANGQPVQLKADGTVDADAVGVFALTNPVKSGDGQLHRPRDRPGGRQGPHRRARGLGRRRSPDDGRDDGFAARLRGRPEGPHDDRRHARQGRRAGLDPLARSSPRATDRPHGTPMLEGMYSAAAGMAAQQQRLDAVSNDIANANTTGYKRVRVAFRDLLYTPGGLATQQGVTEGAGAAATTIGRGYAQGAFQRTDEPLDVALQGQGFLQMKRDGKDVLTRDGNLRFDDQGRLGNARGDRVEPPIQLPAGGDARNVKIAPDGSVTLEGKALGKLVDRRPCPRPTACSRSATTPSPRPPQAAPSEPPTRPRRSSRASWRRPTSTWATR